MSDSRTEPLRDSHEDAYVLCRRLWLSDIEALRAHMRRLDPDTLASRFMTIVDERAALDHAERALFVDGLVVGGFVDGVLRGLGELRPAGRRAPALLLGNRAEAAFDVERPFRCEGLGSALLQRVAGAARSRGVADLHTRCLDDNEPMRQLAAKHGAVLTSSGGETDCTIHLERPTALSWWSEGVSEAVDLAIALADVASCDDHSFSSGQDTIRSTSSSSRNSSSLPATRPRTEIPAS